MRPVDAAKIKKIAKVEKETDPKTGAKKVKGVKEVYVYREKPDQSSLLKSHQKQFVIIPSGLFDPSRSRAISYLTKSDQATKSTSHGRRCHCDLSSFACA